MTSYARIDIYRMAAGRLPRDPPASPDEVSLIAQTCNQWYPMALDALLSRGAWRFLITRASLAQLATNDRPDQWGYAYEAPSGMSWPVRLIPQTSDNTDPAILQVGQTWAAQQSLDQRGLPYELAGSTIYANQPGAVLEYVDGSPTSFAGSGALFIKALYLSLAAKISLPVTKSQSLYKEILSEAELAEGRAIAANNNAAPQTYGNQIPEEALARMGFEGVGGFPDDPAL